jgi:hypothetical protein
MKAFPTFSRPVVRTAAVAATLVALIGLGTPGVASSSASPVVVDIANQQIVFNYDDHTNITPADPDCVLEATDDYCVGKNAGDIVRFNNVVSAGGVTVDAVMETLALADVEIARYEVSSSSSWEENPDWFWTRLGTPETAGSATFRLSFFVSGTYTGPGAGTPVTLLNAQLTAGDINGLQYVQLSDVQGYTFAADTALTFDPTLGRFSSDDTEDDDEFPSRYQVQLSYSSLATLDFGFGFGLGAGPGSASFSLVGEGLPFDGPTVARGPVIAESPAPITGPAPAPAIGFTTTPATDPADWQTLPTCGVYLPGGTEPITGTLAPATYLTRCTGGVSEVFGPTVYIDGELVVTGALPGPVPVVVKPAFTG